MGKLGNKNILITGGNSGIGLAAAQEFYREGARVNAMSAFGGKADISSAKWPSKGVSRVSSPSRIF